MVIAGDVLLVLALIYVLAGCAYGLRFAARTMDRVDDRARLSGPFFRLAVLPGAVLLWPWLIRWERTESLVTSEHDNARRANDQRSA
ncbi:MAG: hypothetical protein KIT83_04725 [Bryobacterales bacterium]|nr:hypothetical protein [Bryobacterales bacterium]